MNVRVWSVVPIVATSVALLAACAAPGGANPSAGGAATTLTVVKVDTTSMDSAAAVWANAPKIELATKAAEKDKPDGPKVTLQAVHDGKNIVFRAEWPDATQNDVRRSWLYDGKVFKRDQEQDRFALAFPIGNNAEFATKGCGAACHSNDPDKEKWHMGVDKKEQSLDMWHWTAAQSGPVDQADDAMITIQEPITATGRKSDANDGGGNKNNQDKENKAPAFMSSKGLDAKFIFASEEIPLDISKLQPNTRIPAYILAPYKGSRGDVAAKAVWANGKWVLVLSRALDTGHDDDTVLIPSKTIPFAMAVFDNSEDLEHTIVQNVLTLAWQ